MRVVIQDNYEKMSLWAADYIAAKIAAHKEERPFVLGLPTGSSPLGVCAELIRKNKAGEISFKNVVTFNMDEYVGLPHEHDQSYWYLMPEEEKEERPETHSKTHKNVRGADYYKSNKKTI